jgi:hypothetical protein
VDAESLGERLVIVPGVADEARWHPADLSIAD